MAGRKLWGVKMAVIMLGLLAMVQQSTQVSLKNPLLLRSRTIRSDDIPAFAIITTSTRIERALKESAEFVVESTLELNGRTFVIGKIYETPVVFCRSSGSPSLHVAITAQMINENFNVRGMIHLGRAGSLNDSMVVGTVSVPHKLAFTGYQEWQSEGVNEKGQLVFSRYNDNPPNGGNLLGSLKYNEIEIYYKGKILESYNVHASSTYLRYASRVTLDSGEVVVGLKSSSSDIYVDNKYYAKFLHKNFGASTAETNAVAVGLAAKADDVRFISFQGVSNQAGTGHASPSDKELASQNVVKAAIRFIWEATVPRHVHDE